jgi:hypothetical protein
VSFFDAIAASFDLDQLPMFDEPFGDGGGHGVITEDLSPVLEGLIGGQDNGSCLGSFGNDLEEEIAALLV